MDTNLIKPLESLLRSWEDMHLILSLSVRSAISLGKENDFNLKLEGPIKHWHELRAQLLNCHNTNFNVDKFISWQKTPITSSFASLPLALYKWMKQSRRVFHINTELQALLNTILITNVKWSDILFPFDAFIITFDDPITFFDGNSHFVCKCVMVSQTRTGEFPELNEPNFLQFRMFEENQGYQIPTLTKRSIKAAMDKGQWRKATKLVCRENEKMENDNRLGEAVISFKIDDLQNSKVSTSALKLIKEQTGEEVQYIVRNQEQTSWKQEHYASWDKVIRLVVGTCLYLATLPSNSPHKSAWKKTQRTNKSTDKSAITQEAQVCTVTNTHKLTADEKKAVSSINRKNQGSGSEKCAHSRRGFWRKQAGKSNDPLAPKCIMVRPALIRPDRLPKGGVISGTKTII